ncbi:MAG: DNA adenine methylase, partial [Clostridia bacterium]|nr:DNA adenine methylase [Clostridia bacterium]
MQPLIKWPGGKSSELEIIKRHLPESYDRYVEPFIGGGALFFDLAPEKSLINDISKNLMRLYAYIAEGSVKFERCVLGIAEEWDLVKEYCAIEAEKLTDLYFAYARGECEKDYFSAEIASKTDGAVEYIAGRSQVISDKETFKKELFRTVSDKLIRTAANEKKFGGLSEDDLKKNVLTGFTSGYYMYMRTMFNAMERDKYLFVSDEYKTAVFFFVREFCYGSMFRYNKSGEFNVPYGGIAYNGKDFGKKAEALFLPETRRILSSARITSTD